jgi:cytochrome c oxidase cbb3-type subunit I/II
LARDYVQPPKPESRLQGAAVLNVAHGLDKWSQLWWHQRWERLPLRFTVWVTIAVIIASLFEIIPTFLIRSNVPTIATVKPYTPLELAGRDVYLAEGCYNCHSQMIRPILSETKRYGEFSKPGEFVYDHPFQWGSRRIGPDLAREGGKQSPHWHVVHFQNPKQLIDGSIMPPYPWLLRSKLNFDGIPQRMRAMQTLGVPYSEKEVDEAIESAHAQAAGIAQKVSEQDSNLQGLQDKKVIALIAYLDRLGVDLFAPPPAEPAGEEGQEPAAVASDVAPADSTGAE